MDIWVLSSFCLLQVKLLWTLIDKSLYGHIYPFLLGKHLGSWINCGWMFNFSRNCQTVFQSGCTNLFPPTVYESSSFCTSYSTPGMPNIFRFSNCNDLYCCFISLKTCTVEHLSVCFPLVICICSLIKYLLRIFALFEDLSCLISSGWILDRSYFFICGLQNFSTAYDFFFHFHNSVFWRSRNLWISTQIPAGILMGIVLNLWVNS